MKKFVLSALLVFFCVASPAQAAKAPLRVVASFGILADMANNVGGEDAAVTSLVGPDSDAHAYQPTPQDAKSVANADIVLVNGLGFEGWMQRLIQASGFKGIVVTASLGVKPRLSAEGNVDPHAWQDLSNARIYAKNIAAALAIAAPDRAAAFQMRAELYDAEIAAMDTYVRDAFADIPPAKRIIITSHDAFGYFGRAYGVRFFAPSGISTDSEASASGVAKLIQQMKTEGIKQVFIENMTNPKLIEQIGKDAGAKLGGTLYSDALSKADGPARTYLAMFRNNVPKLKAAMNEVGK